MNEFIALLDKWKIPYKFLEKKAVDYYKDNFPIVKTIIELENSSTLVGYRDFGSYWLFDQEDNFLAVGHYE